MRLMMSRWSLPAAFCLCMSAVAFAAPEAPKLSFEKPISFRGSLGEEQVQVNLRSKVEVGDGIEGEYFVFGQSKNVLLAGELEGDELFLEESENGKDVSGQWDGKLSGDSISGEWSSADGKTSKPFNIKLIRTTNGSLQAGGAKPESASRR